LRERRLQDIGDSHTKQMHASVFGVFRLKDKDAQEIILSNRRARAILAMLCLAPDEPLEREFVSHLLWPGRFEAQAKASLRQCLLELGKMFADQEDQVLVVSRSQISLNGSVIPTDLFCLERSLAQANYSKAAEQLTTIAGRPLLDRLNFGEAFEQWVDNHRLQTERRLKTW
jgi:DNA-binding SARP family transcriptional activator